MHKRLYAPLLISVLLLVGLALGVSLAQPSAQAQVAFDCASVTTIPVAECEGLVALYNEMDGTNWPRQQGWLQGDDPCAWQGVTCSEGHVISLSFYENRLAGALPAQIGNFSVLRNLYLTSNQITSIPPEIANLTMTNWIGLASNQLVSLPEEIGTLSALTGLALTNNQLSSLPASIGSLPKLAWLNVSNNQLGSLPPQIGGLAGSLTELHLDGNRLTSLPSAVGSLTKLEYLRLHGNPLTGEVPAFLTGLPALGVGDWFFTSPFSFYDTGWCVPPSGPVPDWLSTIQYEGTGMICGQPGGSVSGQTTLAGSGAAAPGIQVSLYRPLQGEEMEQEQGGSSWLPVTHTLSGPDGGYLFADLGYGIDYRVHFVDLNGVYASQYYDRQFKKEFSTPVSLTLGMPYTGVNGVLGPPQPPVAQVDTTGAVSFNPDGTVNISQWRSDRSPITLTLPVTCAGGITPTAVGLLMIPPWTTYPMTQTGEGIYQAVIPADQVQTARLSLNYACDGATQQETVGYIVLHDPSGLITDKETGQPVVGATVTLLRVPGWLPRTGPTDTRADTCESNLSKATGADWSQPAPTDLGVIANPDVDAFAPRTVRQLSDETGYYGWDVSEGCWYVTVAAAGYAPLTSPVVGVPPEVTDLHLSLAPVREIYLPLVLR